MFKIATMVAVCGLAQAQSAPSLPKPLSEVRVESGVLSGLNEGVVHAFLGIPYAAPPIGRLRWRPPQPPVSWKGTLAADHFSPSCMQRPRSGGPWTAEYRIPGRVSEDCLTINIWTPAETGSERLAVMVWIYGGAFKSGSGSVPIYDGRKLAERGIIVATLNYRLGVLGFLAHPQLTAESERKVSGNYGLMDIIAALQWLQRNVAAFGGDAQRLTIAGQSAGGFAVELLQTSPAAQGLFHQAIAESGSAGRNIRWRTLSEAEPRGERYLQARMQRSIDTLREVPVAQLYAAGSSGDAAPDRNFPPIADGITIPDDDDAASAIKPYDVAMLTGLNADESGSFRPSMSASARLAASGAARATLVDWAGRRAAQSQTPLYLYLYDHVEPGTESARWGAFHAAEIPYVFDTLEAAPQRPFSADDREVSRRMAGYWVNFVKTGNPNGPGLPHWPAFNAAAPAVMEIGDRYDLIHDRSKLH
ncbi:MAG: carboxylesterase/lipase family protein [Steroidobacteraceae bacterium]